MWWKFILQRKSKFGVKLETETSSESLADFFNRIILERSGR